MVELNPIDNSKELSYDLRQYQAKIIGEQILRVGETQDQEPHLYFSELEKLYVTIHHKLKDIETDEKEYKKKYDAICKLSQNNLEAWRGNKNRKEYNTIKANLQDLHIWLFMKMEEANLFGAKYQENEDEL